MESSTTGIPSRKPSCKHSNKKSRAAATGYWQLVAGGEPFRLLFPLGAAIGLWGVLMWPLSVWHLLAVYPGQLHARVMIQGFLTCFVVGFLGTALPRLLGVPKVSLLETLGFAVALTWTTWLQSSGQTLWGDVVFFCVMGSLVFGLVVRSIFRRDTPPPAFVLVAMGCLAALFGAGTQVISSVSLSALPAGVVAVGRLLLYQGFLLLPIMGIGAFLLPRFFGLPNRQSFPESLALPPGWGLRALFALACGLGIVASFILEAGGFLRAGWVLRAVVVLVYFLREVPVHRGGWGGGSQALGLRIALFSMPLGYALMAVWPDRAVSFLHVVFISGFSLLTFVVASRVILGHSGQSEKFRVRLVPVLWLIGLVVLAMTTRVSADWMPALRLSHYAYAALAWAVGVVVWAIFILPGVTRADSE